MLDHEAIGDLHSAAVEALGESRKALLAGISPKIVAQLKDASSPSGQLLQDLDELNRVGVLDDGTIPLERWLRNAWQLTAGRPQAKVFRRALEALVGPDGAHPLADRAPLRLVAKRPREEAYLLERVRSTWVDGLLHLSLQEELRIELTRTELPDAVRAPIAFLVDRTDEADRDLDPKESIGEYFERRLRALLVLGEPGAGKTITLLELGEALLSRAEEDPGQSMPVVLNLSSWATRRQPIEAWVVEQLSTHYFVGSAVGREWVKGDRLAYLFDGLDEVEPGARAACVDALNVFRKGHGVSPIAVACRRDEYDALKLQSKLDLDAAIRLRKISATQLDAYFASAGPRLARLKRLLSKDPYLQELAQTPLMLSVMSLAYADDDEAGEIPPSERAGNLEEARRALFDLYVDKMFRRAEEHARRLRTERPLARLPRDQVLKHLIWLARDMLKRGQGVFLLEQLQPWSLPAGLGRTAYFLVSRVVAVSGLVWLFAWLTAPSLQDRAYEFPMFGLWGAPSPPLSLAMIVLCGPSIGLLLGVAYAWIGREEPRSTPRARITAGVVASTILGVAGPVWLLGLLDAPANLRDQAARVLFVSILLFVLGLRRLRLDARNDHTTVESLGLRWKRLGALVMALVGIPVAVTWYLVENGGYGNLWSIPELAPVPMPTSGIATFLSDDLLAVRRYNYSTTSLVDTKTGHLELAPFSGDTAFSRGGDSVLTTQQHWFGRARRVTLHRRQGTQWKQGPTFKLAWQPWTIGASYPCLVVSATGERAIASNQRQVWIHDTSSGAVVAQIPGGIPRLTTDRQHVTIPQGTGFSIRELSDGAEMLRVTPNPGNRLLALDTHPSEEWVAMLDGRGRVYRLDPTGYEKPSFFAHVAIKSNAPTEATMMFSPTGERLAVATQEALFLLAVDGHLIARYPLEDPERWKWSVCPDREPRISFSANGAVLMERHSSDTESWVNLYRALDGEKLGTIGPLGLGSSALSPDGTKLVTSSSRLVLLAVSVSMVVTILGLVAAIIGALRTSVVQSKTRPNEGMRLTARWSAFLGCGGSLISAAIVEGARAVGFLEVPGIARWLIPVFVGSCIIFVYGGLDVFQHYLVRLLLALRGDLPFRSAPFLDGAARLVLLRKVGGGYIFIHRLFTEYFAADAERLLAAKPDAHKAPRDPEAAPVSSPSPD